MSEIVWNKPNLPPFKGGSFENWYNYKFTPYFKMAKLTNEIQRRKDMPYYDRDLMNLLCTRIAPMPQSRVS